MYLLNRYLKTSNEYIPIKISFEGIGNLIFEDKKIFSKEFL
ncbi:hypothetical protein P9J83_07505 [Clostridium sporogenes]|uniref:Uncharacterized protein n=1 Tax=Clostridium sporogenes TaxID=1509 RepID=A0AAE4JUY7_CLOSG|nr:hypothetical protein [Clostridium sporogenes]MDS1003339.1 hypothetical protein [Clostridium sporogenes]